MGSKQPISSSISQIPSLDHKPQELSSSVLPDSTKHYNMREIHRQVLDSTSITMANMNPTGEKVAIKKIDKGYLINDFLKKTSQARMACSIAIWIIQISPRRMNGSKMTRSILWSWNMLISPRI